MAFKKQLLPTCPACKEPRLRVIETEATGASVRRRKKCDACGHRVTTHEISEEAFNASKQNAAVLNKIYTALNKDAPVMDVIKCFDCKFNNGDHCSLDLPEFGTDEAYDCNLFSPSP